MGIKVCAVIGAAVWRVAVIFHVGWSVDLMGEADRVFLLELVHLGLVGEQDVRRLRCPAGK